MQMFDCYRSAKTPCHLKGVNQSIFGRLPYEWSEHDKSRETRARVSLSLWIGQLDPGERHAAFRARVVYPSDHASILNAVNEHVFGAYARN
jgi:hypothetical protein